MGCSSSKDGPTVVANVKAVHNPDSTWHAPVARALCASGGGSRALSYTMGVYRGLNELNLIPKLDAISSVSGGTWCSSIFMFAKSYKGNAVTTVDLVGADTTPQLLTMSELSKAPGAIASGIVQGDADKILAELSVEFVGREYEVWPHVMSRWLLRDFDSLKELTSYMALDDEAVSRIKAANPQLEKKTFVTPRSDRPKMYIMCATVLAPLNYLATNSNAVSFQQMPDYIGSPFYPNDQQVKYQKAALCGCDENLYKCCKTTRTVGGGFVESFAFGGEAPQKQSGGEGIPVGEPSAPWALPCAVGSSSWGPGGFANASSLAGDIGNIRTKYWPVTSPMLPKAQAATTYEVGDGGLIDNSGMMALLQRKAPKIVWVASAFTSFSTSYDWANATPENFDPASAGVVDQLYVLFGYNTTSPDYYYANDQVFDQSLCLETCKELRDLQLAGKPAVLKKKFTVLQNNWWGIVGGWEVEWVVLYLAKSTNFESQLPEETQSKINEGDSGPFANFPIYKTEMQNGAGDALGLTTEQVNLLAAQGEWSVLENAPLFTELLS